MSNVRVGSVVTGTVVVVTDNCAFVNIGLKCEGQMYRDYYSNDKKIESLKEVLHVGDEIKVQIAKFVGENAFLSRLELEEKERREKVTRRIVNHKPFMATVKGKNKDGNYVLSKDGVTVILPAKYVDLKDDFDADSLLNTEVKVVYVRTEEDEKGRKTFVVSRKQVQYNDEKKARTNEFDSINVGDELTGKVERITDFGAFVRFNAVEGLCHLSELSHHHINHPSDVVAVGDEITCKVIKKTESKLHLSKKALEQTPWEIFSNEHKVGDVVECVIVKKNDSYILVSPAKDVIGILNQNDYSWKKNDDFASKVNENDKITLQITYLDKDKKKMTLSKKHLEYNPWADVNIKVHDIVTGTVLRFTNNGAIIKVGNVEAFMSNKDASELDDKTASDLFKVGDSVTAEAVVVNPAKWILTLSIRSIEEAKSREYVNKYINENVSSSTSLEELLNKKN